MTGKLLTSRLAGAAHPARPRAGNWSVGARSETGYVRDENQDRMGWIRAPFGDVYIVSDGMGGVGDGALAAELTVQALQRQLGEVRLPWSLRGKLRRAVEEANRVVHACAATEAAGTPGMGATAVAVLTRAASLVVAHVGDSRAYLYSGNGHCQRLTRDHSVVQHLVDRGELTPAQAMIHPKAHVIERAVGHAADIEVEVGAWLPLREGDLIMVCSDGLSGYAQDAEIAAVLRAHPDPQDAADRLVDLALAKGGEDNITVQVIRYGGADRRASRLHPVELLVVVLTSLVTSLVASSATVMIGQRYRDAPAAAAAPSRPPHTQAATARPSPPASRQEPGSGAGQAHRTGTGP